LPCCGHVCSNPARLPRIARLSTIPLETFMKQLITLAAALALAISTSAFANSHKEAPGMAASGAMAGGAMGSCDAKAAGKKLSGAAKTSFVKKCETDATTACDAQAAEKKLAGAAKTSFTKKCVADASAAAK
jgi:hypothetical protein